MLKLHNIDFHIDIQEKLKEYLKDKGIEFSQKGIHFGNACLINIPDNLIEEIKQNFSIQYRNQKNILEQTDLFNFSKGEKITIEYLETDFFPIHNQKATIYDIKGNTLIVRAYKSKNKGWYISVGDNCNITKGW